MRAAIRSFGISLILLCTALVVSMFTGHNLWDIGKWVFTTGSKWVITTTLALFSLLSGIYLSTDAVFVEKDIRGWFHKRREKRKRLAKAIEALVPPDPYLKQAHEEVESVLRGTPR